MLCNVYRAIIASVCLSVSLSVPFPIILRRRIRIKAEKKIRMKQASLVTNRHWMRTYTKHSTVPYTSLICNKKNYIRPTPNLWKREKKESWGLTSSSNEKGKNYEKNKHQINLPIDGVVPWQYTSNSVVVVIVTCTFVCFNKKLATKWFSQNTLFLQRN